MQVGEKIKIFLGETGVSQAYISKKTGISTSKLNLSLNAKRKLSFEEYEMICWALGVSSDRFLTPRSPNNKDTA